MDNIKPGQTRALCIRRYVSNSASQLSLANGNEVVIQSMKNVPKNGLCLVEFQDLEGYCPFDYLSVVIEDDDIDDDVENKSYSQTISINTVEERQIIGHIENKIKINEAPMRCSVIAPPPPPQMTQTQNVPTETIQQTISDEINNAQNRSNFLNSIKGFSRQNLRRIPNAEKIHHSQSKTTKGTINSLEETLKKGLENVITSRRLQLAGESDDEDENNDEMDGWDGEE